MGQSDTGSNEYEDSSDEYTNEGTALILRLIASALYYYENNYLS